MSFFYTIGEGSCVLLYRDELCVQFSYTHYDMTALGTAPALLMCVHNYVSFHSTEQWQRRTGSHARMSTASTRYTCTEECCVVYPLQLVGNKFNALLPTNCSGYGCVSVL